LKIYTGAKTVNKAILLADVMKNIITPRVYYSSNNFAVIVFSTDASVERKPITVTWTTSEYQYSPQGVLRWWLIIVKCCTVNP